MAYNNNYGKPKIATGAEGQTVWLKQKKRKNKKGEEVNVWQASFDLGAGKMIKISLPGDLYTVSSDKGDLLPAYVSKWKAENRTNGTNRRSW